MGYLVDASRSLRSEAISQLEALIAGDALRAVNPVGLMVLSTALACVGLNTALRKLLDSDVTDEEQRAQLATDISDVILHGVMPRD